MKLEDFLTIQGTDENLAQLIMLFGKQAINIKAGFLSARGAADTQNVYGETQMALDKRADELLITALTKSKLVRWIATEEQPDIIEVEGAINPFGVTIDPLDGSSLIDVNLAVGTIVGIYPGHVLEPGNTMLGALYILYGPLTTLTYTTGGGVHEFVMGADGTFTLMQENLTIPDGKIYAPGALRKDYLPYHKQFIDQLESEGYKLRFSGSFVADVHQILHKGGVFTYPAFAGKENGKLRLLFEGTPMGKVVTEAGGAASNGTVNLLDVKPAAVSDRTPIYIGGRKEIAFIESIKRS
ncbi:MAG: class 1 fructose-bisphosphatase [Methanosarcinales archaeon]|nr:fructose-1,6-bisphosphatase [ANME-2 cluster archaeon]MDW7775353.1 class 1 fructose-bisphosphatase [Methanosarcinales archaeon]